MSVDFVQAWTWGPITTSGGLQTNYFRIPFGGAPHIVGTSYLAEVSTGASGGTAGVAVASFKRFEFFDDNGIVQETEITSVASIIEVERCVSITIALDLTDATGCGGWSFYWLS
jgi:hypothetical protein